MALCKILTIDKCPQKCYPYGKPKQMMRKHRGLSKRKNEPRKLILSGFFFLGKIGKSRSNKYGKGCNRLTIDTQ